MSFDLVIFDCDGVLVDSERISNRVLAQCLTEVGLSTSTEESIRDYMGRSMGGCLEIIEARLGRPVPEGWVEDFRARVDTEFRRDLRPVPGVEAALDGIDLPCCVASSSRPQRIRTSLEITGLIDRFEGRLFSASEVPRGKPHPDVFLLAARRMNAEPARCAVVEDSPLGVQAGAAAGMAVFGFARDSDADVLAGHGARVFREMNELPGLLFAPGVE
ncbi:MAG: HAD family hydrolase [Proteobacteria bacterium]|nr:HAD family hydrolase [Pseudomonadota bacterium]MCZ6782840.1 HAD family hydrolase [Pseudomonadota bacterium]